MKYVYLFIYSVLSLINFDFYASVVLVTGGAGFIGSHVAERLLARGDHIVIVDNMNDYYEVNRKYKNIETIQRKFPQLKFYMIDICDKEALELVFKKHSPDLVCHLAARAGVRASIEQPELYSKTNILGTINLLELAKKYPVKNFVMASTSNVYGITSKAPFNENDAVDKPINPYAASKRACELLCYVYNYLFKIPCSCLRFFTVYGPRGRPDMAPYIFLDAIIKGNPIFVFGDGAARRDFTYIDDIVTGVVESLDRPVPFEIYNLGRGEPVVLKDFITTIEEVVGKKANIIYTQQVAGDVDFTHADIAKAQKLLNYNPSVSVKEGLTNFYEWYSQEYN